MTDSAIEPMDDSDEWYESGPAPILDDPDAAVLMVRVGLAKADRARERYNTHPTEARKLDALESFMGTGRAHSGEPSADGGTVAEEIAELRKDFGGRREDRTRDLRIANARGEQR